MKFWKKEEEVVRIVGEPQGFESKANLRLYWDIGYKMENCLRFWCPIWGSQHSHEHEPLDCSFIHATTSDGWTTVFDRRNIRDSEPSGRYKACWNESISFKDPFSYGPLDVTNLRCRIDNFGVKYPNCELSGCPIWGPQHTHENQPPGSDLWTATTPDGWSFVFDPDESTEYISRFPRYTSLKSPPPAKTVEDRIRDWAENELPEILTEAMDRRLSKDEKGDSPEKEPSDDQDDLSTAIHAFWESRQKYITEVSRALGRGKNYVGKTVIIPKPTDFPVANEVVWGTFVWAKSETHRQNCWSRISDL